MLVLTEDAGCFKVTVLEAAEPACTLLFAVGGGGNPERHLPLLTALADSGCLVVAPHFERLVSPTPTCDDLLMRARRLELALDTVARPGLPVAGVGHSIGATMLLALAGAEARTRDGDLLPVTPDPRLERLVIFAPATDFFRGPKALDAVRIPIFAWAGAADEITPPEQVQFLRRTLNPDVPVEVRIVEGAGHFSFMHELPPRITDGLSDRDAFLADLTAMTCRVAVGDSPAPLRVVP